MAPEYEKAAGLLKSTLPNVKLAKVDATVESKLGEKHGIQGYPTLKFWKDSETIDYDGGRTSDGECA